jgi:hypothetical protein
MKKRQANKISEFLRNPYGKIRWNKKTLKKVKQKEFKSVVLLSKYLSNIISSSKKLKENLILQNKKLDCIRNFMVTKLLNKYGK